MSTENTAQDIEREIQERKGRILASRGCPPPDATGSTSGSGAACEPYPPELSSASTNSVELTAWTDEGHTGDLDLPPPLPPYVQQDSDLSVSPAPSDRPAPPAYHEHDFHYQEGTEANGEEKEKQQEPKQDSARSSEEAPMSPKELPNESNTSVKRDQRSMGSVCERHWRAGQTLGCEFNVLRCRCHLTDAQVQRYNQHIRQVDRLRHSLDSEISQDRLVLCLRELFDALTICDDDTNVHALTLYLARQAGLSFPVILK